MRLALITSLMVGAVAVTNPNTVEAGHKHLRQDVHRSVTQAMKRNAQVRKQIQRDARLNRLSPALQRDLRRSLQQDAQRDRLVHRDIHQSLNRPQTFNRQLRNPGVGYGYRIPNSRGSSVNISPRGIGYSTGGFSIFFGR